MNIIGKIFTLLFSVLSVAFTFVTVIQLTLFLSNFSNKVDVAGNSTSHGSDAIAMATWSSIIDISLLILFVIQHSLLAAPLARLMTYVGTLHLHRIIYNLMACTVMQVVIFLWRPIPDYELWNFAFDDDSNSMLELAFKVIHILAWLTLYIMTISFDITELLGIKSVYNYYFNNSEDLTPGRKSVFIEKMKHPGFFTLVTVLWIYPVMRLDRIIIAVMWPVYMVMTWNLNENDYNYALEQRQKKFSS